MATAWVFRLQASSKEVEGYSQCASENRGEARDQT